MSEATSASLLERVRDTSDAPSWVRFCALYSPLLLHWLRVAGLQDHDADDLAQEVLIVLARRLPEFRYDPSEGRFRGWLRGVVANCLRNWRRGQARVPAAQGGSDFQESLHQLEDDSSEMARAWDVAHDRFVLLGLLDQVEPEFEPATVAAFRLAVLEGRHTAAVAAELGVSANAVLVAKSRVLRRLRQEAAGLAG